MYDRAEIVVRGGDGGGGVVSFRHEKFVPFGGPDGGDGGDGGDVIFMADSEVGSLIAFNRKRVYRAGNGNGGQGKRQHGRKGETLRLAVPVGTVVLERSESGDSSMLADLARAGQQAVVARGGRGGLGNVHFASSTNQAPRIAQKGELGEEKTITLEMMLIADAGIIGYPNVGKSTLLAAVSAANPRIAGYPFTTKEPVLGVVEAGSQRFVLAEIPGLIDGAHQGRGLGHEFLRHIMRTKILIHVIDGTAASPVEDMIRVNTELNMYDSLLAHKPQILVVNKIDLPQVQARLNVIKDAFRRERVAINFVSAATGAGVRELMERVSTVLVKEGHSEKEKEIPVKVFRPRPRGLSTFVRREGDVFVVEGAELQRIIAGTYSTSNDMSQELKKLLVRQGVARSLERAGVKQGDRVRCGDIEWVW